MGDTDLFGRYHRLIRDLAWRRPPDDVWRTHLQQILRRLDDDCGRLPQRSAAIFRQELASQIEHELLGCSSLEAGAVLSVALKHLDAVA